MKWLQILGSFGLEKKMLIVIFRYVKESSHAEDEAESNS